MERSNMTITADNTKIIRTVTVLDDILGLSDVRNLPKEMQELCQGFPIYKTELVPEETYLREQYKKDTNETLIRSKRDVPCFFTGCGCSVKASEYSISLF